MTIIIRPYKQTDRDAVLHIHWETGFIGKSMSSIYTNKKQWAKRAIYYVNKEPESIFVAEDTTKKKVVGYVFGCLDDTTHNAAREMIPEIAHHIFCYPFMNKKDKKFARNLLSFIWGYLVGKGKLPKEPKNAGHLHINLLPEARGKKVGSKLLKTFLAYAKEKGVKTIHADSFQTRLNPNTHFWEKNGFTEFTKAPIDYWKKYYPKEDINICFYVKEL